MITAALTVVSYGCLMGVGFHLSKRVINQAEYLIYIKGPKYKKLLKKNKPLCKTA